MTEDWLLISLKDLTIQETVPMKNIVSINICLVSVIRPIFFGMGCFDPVLGMWPDLTWPNYLDSPKDSLLAQNSIPEVTAH